MGGSKSSSSSSQSQSTSTLSDESVKDLAAGGSIQGVDFSNITGGITNPQVTINTDGLDSQGVSNLINAFGMAAETTIGTIARQADQATAAITDVARSATGTQSELGAVASKFALPVIILIALYIVVKGGLFK